MHGNRWCDIAKQVTGRTDNAIKNRFNSNLSKRLAEPVFAKILSDGGKDVPELENKEAEDSVTIDVKEAVSVGVNEVNSESIVLNEPSKISVGGTEEQLEAKTSRKRDRKLIEKLQSRGFAQFASNSHQSVSQNSNADNNSAHSGD